MTRPLTNQNLSEKQKANSVKLFCICYGTDYFGLSFVYIIRLLKDKHVA